MPSWNINNYEDFDKYLNEQLNKLKTDYIDFYLLHALSKNYWPKLKDLGVFEWAEKAKKDGRIKYLGFSFHDDYEVFEKILEDANKFTFCQIQLNYMDTEYQAGIKGLKLAAEKGLAVVIMEPIKGGKLAVTPPKTVQEVWDKSKTNRSPAEWALQWVWNHPEVSVVLSGMSEMKHVNDNIEFADRSGPETLSQNELSLIEEVKQAYLNLGFVGCTACRYCMPCPHGVDIPTILGLYNEYYMRGQIEEIKKKYWEQITDETHSTNCIACGICEEQCPQTLPIRKFMFETRAYIFRKPEQ
jgi:predicted aldo/keto reductase-like oxidoreductase